MKKVFQAKAHASRRASRAAWRLLTLLAALPAALPAQTTFTENFNSSTAPGWVFGANPGDSKPFLTAATGASGYDGSGNAIGAPIDTSGNGWLRLNTNTNNQSTFALLDTQIFSVNARIEINMEYAFWNGSGADGITFFLVDGNVNSSSFVPGAYGGSMGYAQRTGEAGMPGGYLGFALDNFGNYSNGSEGRNGGVTLDGTLYPNRISVRGPETSNYAYIASNSTPLAGEMDFPTYTTRPDQTGVDYRAFKIVLDANNQLTVQMKFGASGAFATAFTADLSAYERPDTFKIGFTGATGGSTEIHEVRNLTLTSSPWSVVDGGYEWDRGAGSTTWGATPGAANANWFTTGAGNNQTPLAVGANAGTYPGADILFGNKPTQTGTTGGPRGGPAVLGDTETVDLGTTSTSVRSLTFDTGLNYVVNGTGVLTLGNGTGSSPQNAGIASINVNDYNGVYGRHKINTDLSIVENIAIRNYSYSTLCINGAIGLGANTLTTSGFGSTNLNGVITGSGPIVVNGATFNPSTGAGIVTISGNNAATYTGAITVNNGQLVVLANNALGNTGSGTTVNSGGTLTFRGGVTSPENVTIAGVGTTLGRGEQAGALYNDGGDSTLSGTVTLGADAAVGSRSGNLTLSGVISDGASDFSLTKINDGVVTLSGTNTYSGATIISGGALRVTTAGSLSTNSNLQLNGGVLEIAGDLNGGTNGDFSQSRGVGAGQVQWIGDGGFSASGTNRTVRLNNGTGNVTWASTANFVGNGFALLLGSDYADSTLTFANALSLNGAQREIRVANGSAAVDGSLTGRIRGGDNAAGAGGIIKTGAGTLSLSATNNDYSGATEIRAGALRIAATGALSANSNVQLNGGVLELGADLNGVTAGDYSPTLNTTAGTLRWTGDGGFSAFEASSATRTVTIGGGDLVWGTANFVQNNNALLFGSTSSNANLTLTNNLTLGASGDRTIRTTQGTNTAVASGTLSGIVSGAATLAVAGNGRLDLTADNIHTGAVTITGAELRLASSAASPTTGDLAQSSGFSVRLGGTLTLDNTAATAAVDRVGAVGVTLSGASLSFLGQTGNVDTTETIGTVTLSGTTATGGTSGSANTINVARGDATGSATLTAAALTRNAGTTVNFTTPAGTLGATGDNPRLVFTSAPALNDGLLAYATVNGTDFATHGTDGIAAATYTSGGDVQTAWTAATVNASVTADQVLGTGRTVSALKLGDGVDVTGAFSLTVESGGLLTTGATNGVTISGGTLTTGNSNDLVVHAYNTGTTSGVVGTQISSTITGSGGLVKSGSGTLTLGGTSANTYTGVTRLNEGTLVLGKSDGIAAIAGDGNTSTTDLFIGDGRGVDTLRLAANEQIANDVNVVLQGGVVGNAANRAVLDLNGTTLINGAARAESFRSLRIEGNSVVDFTGGTVCAPTFLYLDFLDVASDALLTVGSWIEFTDFLLVKKVNFDSTDMPRIVFDGYGGSASWKDYDSAYYQIVPYAPVPEPGTYGALAVGGLTAFAVYRRRQKRIAA